MLVACLLIVDENGQRQREIRSFGTVTAELLALADWLASQGCTIVAMESTGVYWKPIFNILEGQLEVLLANARHLKAVPGRKTDVKDAQWIAELLEHGLLKASFIPQAPQRELRELTRYRTSLVAERARLVNRLQKLLEDANLKLSAVATDLKGASARAMLKAIAGGEEEAAKLAQLARGRMRNKLAELEEALKGRVKSHHRFMLTHQLAHLDYLEEQIAAFGTEIERRMADLSESEQGKIEQGSEQEVEATKGASYEGSKGWAQPNINVQISVETQIETQAQPMVQNYQLITYQKALELLDGIPGVNQRIAEIVLSEIGVDMRRFPSAKHLASWAGLCPGNYESAGKRLSGRTRKGSQWLRQALVEAAQAAMHTKECYFQVQGSRIAARRGRKKAVIAVAHSILVIIYYLLSRGKSYQDLGPSHLEEQDKDSAKRRAVLKLEKLGYKVTLTEPELEHQIA
jgi:transposase